MYLRDLIIMGVSQVSGKHHHRVDRPFVRGSVSERSGCGMIHRDSSEVLMLEDHPRRFHRTREINDKCRQKVSPNEKYERRVATDCLSRSPLLICLDEARWSGVR
jgi:hypothetical protein